MGVGPDLLGQSFSISGKVFMRWGSCFAASPSVIIHAPCGDSPTSSLFSKVMWSKNGCTGPDPVPENTGGPTHVTVDHEGCGNHPVRWATFAGGHIWDAADNGQPTWVPGEVWEFISQF